MQNTDIKTYIMGAIAILLLAMFAVGGVKGGMSAMIPTGYKSETVGTGDNCRANDYRISAATMNKYGNDMDRAIKAERIQPKYSSSCMELIRR